MTKTIQATYEDGVFKPSRVVTDIPDGQRVTLTITAISERGSLLDCYGTMQPDDAAEMPAIINWEFGHQRSS